MLVTVTRATQRRLQLQEGSSIWLTVTHGATVPTMDARGEEPFAADTAAEESSLAG